MIGVLIATHGQFSKGILQSAELIIGKQTKIKTMTLEHEDSIDLFEEEMIESINSLDEGDGVLVLVDVFGGSPANIALRRMRDINYRTLTGLNMPMLLEILSSRSNCTDLEELTAKGFETGKEGIRDLYKQLMELL